MTQLNIEPPRSAWTNGLEKKQNKTKQKTIICPALNNQHSCIVIFDIVFFLVCVCVCVTNGQNHYVILNDRLKIIFTRPTSEEKKKISNRVVIYVVYLNCAFDRIPIDGRTQYVQ